MKKSQVVLVRVFFQKKTRGEMLLQKYMPQYAHAYCLVALANTLARSK